MKKIINLLGTATLAIALTVPVNAFAKDVYPERSIMGIYVLSAEGDRALIKAKGADKEYVIVGDVIGEERMVVTEISSLSITVKSENGDTASRLPVGGGFNY